MMTTGKRSIKASVAGLIVLVFALYASSGQAASGFSQQGTGLNSVYYGIRG